MYVPATDRLHQAWHRRAETDHRFDFWTALGWTILTFGISSYDIAQRPVPRPRWRRSSMPWALGFRPCRRRR